MLTFGPDGLLYVGTMAGEIFTIDENGAPALYVDGFIARPVWPSSRARSGSTVSSRVVDVNEGGEVAAGRGRRGDRPITGLPLLPRPAFRPTVSPSGRTYGRGRGQPGRPRRDPKSGPRAGEG